MNILSKLTMAALGTSFAFALFVGAPAHAQGPHGLPEGGSSAFVRHGGGNPGHSQSHGRRKPGNDHGDAAIGEEMSRQLAALSLQPSTGSGLGWLKAES